MNTNEYRVAGLVDVRWAIANHKTPLVDGIPDARGSSSVACRRARAVALKIASTTWCVFRPWCRTTCRLNAPAYRHHGEPA